MSVKKWVVPHLPHLKVFYRSIFCVYMFSPIVILHSRARWIYGYFPYNYADLLKEHNVELRGPFNYSARDEAGIPRDW